MSENDDMRLSDLGPVSLPEGIENGEWDEQVKGWLIREDDEYYVHVRPMIFNDRILLTRKDEYPKSWVAGYCYDRGVAAFLAAAAWDPKTQKRPKGYKKIAHEQARSLIHHENEIYKITISDYVGDAEHIVYGHCKLCPYKTQRKYTSPGAYGDLTKHMRDKHNIDTLNPEERHD